MDWVRLLTTYHRDDALANAGEAAEVLFGRALSYCGDQETNGFVSDAAARRLTPTRTKARTDALVRVGLWERDEPAGGWWIRSWDRIQESHDSMAARRKAARERQRRHRAGQNGSRPEPPPGYREGISEDPVTRDVTRDNPRDETRDSRDRARANARESKKQLLEADHQRALGASLDAHDDEAPDEPVERTATQRLTARYAAGVRLADAGQAMRTIGQALTDDGIPEQLIANGIDVLITEQSSCTRGRLRVALLKAEGNWGQPGTAGNPYLNDLRAAATDPAPAGLRAVPDPPALEAK